MAMEVVLLTPDWEEAWQRYVSTSPQATLAHLLGWRNVVQKMYHHTPYYLMAIDGQSLEGVLPLFLIKSPFFGKFLVTAPYLSYGGMVADNECASYALTCAAQDLATEQKVKYVEIRGLQHVGQGLVLKKKYCTFLLSLNVGSDAIWQRFEGGKVRRAIRKALKTGMVIERGHHLIEAFTEVMNRHMRDLGTPFHPIGFYRRIVEEIPHQLEIIMARHGDQYVGGILLISSRDTVYWYCGAGLRQYQSLAPMSLLIWEAIRSACENGFEFFDFGRSRWESGTFHFKRKWGAQPVQLFYEYHLQANNSLPDVDPTNAKFQWAISLWKQLPVFVTKTLGPLIVRYIP